MELKSEDEGDYSEEDRGINTKQNILKGISEESLAIVIILIDQ